MSDYELISGFGLIALNFVLVSLTVALTDKVLRVFFMILLMFSIPLTMNTLTVIAIDNSASANLITSLNTAYMVSIFITITVVSYFIIRLIIYSLDKMRNATLDKNKKANNLPELQEDLLG